MYLRFILLSIIIEYSFPAFCQNMTNELVNQYSQGSVEIIAIKNGHGLWMGTGFVVEQDSNFYLITNNHVLGGEYKIEEYKRQHNKQLPLDSIPDSIYVRFYTNLLGSFSWKYIAVSDQNNNHPLWIKFYEKDEKLNSILDVGAINITSIVNMPDVKVVYANEKNMNNDLVLFPGLDLYIVGYPSDSGHIYTFPVWKRGSIATEPNFIDIGNSTFFIDATTRGGMSGSPVWSSGSGYLSKNGAYMMGVYSFLVGIYSAQNYNLELGVVTRLEKIFRKLKALHHP
jgi:hypothetical protein